MSKDAENMFEVIDAVKKVEYAKELSISPRRWWQFSDTFRISRKLRKLRGSGILHFAPGVYVMKRTLKIR